MKRASSLKRRVREIEEARGTGGLTVQYSDGSSQGFHLDSKNDALKVLLASFDIARSAANPDAPAPSDTRFTRIAREVGKAQEIRPDQALWNTVRNIVTSAEEDARNCKSHARNPASG